MKAHYTMLKNRVPKFRKKRNTNVGMYLFYIIIIGIAFFGIWAFWHLGYFGGRIEQSVLGKKYGTYLWYNEKIIWAKFDEIKDLNDSLKQIRYNEALKIKKAL